MLRPMTVLLAAALLVGACSAKPVSQATEQTVPPAATGAATVTPAPSPEPTPAPTEPTGAGPTVTPEPLPSAAPGIPPKPADTTWTLLKQVPVKSTGRILETYRVTWTAPDGVADEFIVYGVEGCLRESKKNDGKPCVVKGMPIPRDRLVKLATAGGDARETQVTYEIGEAGPGPYGAILIRAANKAGKSIFTIVHSDDVCWACTY
jgi:hypothetical protein